MGSLIAARLALAGEDVVLFGRDSPHLAAVLHGGLTLVEKDGTRRSVPLRATSDPEAARGAELVIVLVKAWATAQAIAPLREAIPREARVLTLQNGLGNAAALRATLRRPDGARPAVLLGVTTQAALRESSGEVIHTGDGITAIGRRRAGPDSHLTAIARTLSSAGVPTVAVDDIHRWVWRKLAVNAAINPLTALAGVPNRDISTDRDLRAAAAALAREVTAVALANGINLDAQDVVAAVNDVARASGTNRSSMLHDLEAGNRTEIDAINGAVVTEAARVHVPAPLNHAVTALVRARERLSGPQPEKGGPTQ
ncbi:MAG: 2-dehydropantoate 2-reductase [Chloroflexota bacterium]|nr:2-dehydropantoate 2-reductase [Chloroflexota bacterium]